MCSVLRDHRNWIVSSTSLIFCCLSAHNRGLKKSLWIWSAPLLSKRLTFEIDADENVQNSKPEPVTTSQVECWNYRSLMAYYHLSILLDVSSEYDNFHRIG